jgi:hypothetical protein
LSFSFKGDAIIVTNFNIDIVFLNNNVKLHDALIIFVRKENFLCRSGLNVKFVVT